MSDLIERLKTRWVADGLTLRPGASSEALDAFESRYRIVLPPIFRDYLAAVDGMTDDLDGPEFPWDRDTYRFWGLPTLLSVRDFWSDRGMSNPPRHEFPDWTDCWFPFADYLINSHAYAIRLSADGGPVCLWDFAKGRFRVASSFAEFLTIYLDRSRKIFGEGIEVDDRFHRREDGQAAFE